MEAADSGSLLIRAPVSLPEDGEGAAGGDAFSDEEDFFLSGDEEDGSENFEEVSKPAVLTKVASMPKAPVTVDEDDTEEDAEANGHSNGEIPEETSDIAGNSNSPASEGDSKVDEKKKEDDENINSLSTEGDSKINETKIESDEDRSSLAVEVSGNSPSDELDKESDIQVELDKSGSSLKSEEGLKADEKTKESGEDSRAGSNLISHETDEDEKDQIKLGSSSTATESREQSLGIEAGREESREDPVSSSHTTELLGEESKKDEESREELGSSSPATEESKKEKSGEVLDSLSPTIELREEVIADEIKRDEESRAEPVSPPLAKLNEESLAREADKEDESREIPLSSSLADETSKEEESGEDPVSSSPPAKIHEESLVDETKKEESSTEGPVSSSPPAKVQEGTISDETGKQSQEVQTSLSPSAEFDEESLADEAKKEESSREGLVSSPSPAKFQEESLSDETNTDEGSREEPVSSSPPAKFLEESLANETNVKEDTREDPVSCSPPANVHEESTPDEVNKEEESQEELISPSPPSQLHEEARDNKADKEIKTRDALPAPPPPAETLEGEKSDEANKEIKVQEHSIVDETVKDSVTSPPSNESHVLQNSVERTHALDEEETEEKRLIDEVREVVEDSVISAAEDQEDELIKAAIPSIEDSDEDVGPIEEGSLLDGQIVSYSDEEDSDEENDGKELFDSAALTALLKAASGASANGEITFTSSDGTRIFSVDRPAGLGSSIPPLKPSAPRPNRSNIFSPTDLSLTPEPDAVIDEEEKKLQENVDKIKIKFLRLVHRLGHSPEDRVVAQVLYRLSLAEGIRRGRQTSRIFSLENAKKRAVELEEEGKEKLDFSCTILLLGKTGVGKSSLVNSIFGEKKVDTSAFDLSTHSVKVISGMVDGVYVRVIDTPGLRPSVMDQATNTKILNSVKKVTKRCPPDIVLYVDRLDTQAWDFNDLPLLRSIAVSMGSAVWFNAIVALTHGASAPPEGSTGSPLSYEVFVDQRSRVVQHAIRQAAGDMRLMNPVSLVENHPSCRRNREGQRILPNGLSWRSQLLLLCYSSKILSEANSILKLQDSSPSKLFGFRTRSPPLPFLLSSLLQSKPHPKPDGVDQGDSDFDLDDLDEEPEEEEDEYDRLPPFKPLRKAQLAKLTKTQKQAYFDEYEYRVKLLQKKQYKEELKQARERKKREKQGQDLPFPEETPGDYDDSGAPATIPVPLPDMVLPPSFDCDNPAFRYRFLEPSSQLLTRPVLDSHGWDHDCGYDGVSLEDNLTLVGKYPASVSAQITKDKKDFTIHVDSSIAAMHGENGSTLAGFDVQSIGKQLAYILRSETKFKTMKKNKTAAGVSVTFLGENIAAGMKVEDELVVGKRLGVAASAGTMRSKGDAAYGANVEIRLRDKEFPIGQDLSTLGLSLMRWRGDLALGANLQSQFSVGRGSKMAVRVGLNNKRSGQVTVKLNSSEQLQIAFMAIVPVAASIYRSFFSEE